MSQTQDGPPLDDSAEARPLLPIALQRALTFVLGAVVFTVIFWSLWFLALKPVLAPTPEVTAKAPESTAQSLPGDLMRKYQQQAQDADAIQRDMQRQIDANTEIQKRQSRLIAQQEEQTRRFEEVLRRWEAQAGIKRRSAP